MRKIIFALALLFAPSAHAQIDAVLLQIEQNNTTLRALADQAEADKWGNRTGISLPDPEVGFGRLWGHPASVGNRTDVAVSQGFDIATITGMKFRQAQRQNTLVDLQFATERTLVLLEAHRTCIELIHLNRTARELALRLRHARTIADGYAERLASGDAGRLEYNKAMLNLAAVEGDVAQNEVERRALRDELQRLNGGVEIALDDTEYPPVSLPDEFETWYVDAAEASPVLEYVRRDAEANRKQLSLSRVEGLPEFSVGYMREQTLGQHYQGVTVGMSIPLFGNRNRVKQARASVQAAEARERDAQIQLYEQLRNLYTRAMGLQRSASEYRRAMTESGSAELLKKALDAGEMSLLEYIVEMGLYYDSVNRLLTAERDFQLAYAQLSAVWL